MLQNGDQDERVGAAVMLHNVNRRVNAEDLHEKRAQARVRGTLGSREQKVGRAGGYAAASADWRACGRQHGHGDNATRAPVEHVPTDASACKTNIAGQLNH
eukprot:364875-Chlamydomonas_euryale.AAC.4